ncbi:MAG: recombinase family protein [Acutalibacteraceae bacterium]|nr:recombinase family protein [Acutalibacteraceae bacterium]
MTIYSTVSLKEYTANYKEKGSDFMARKSRIPEYNKIPMRKKIGVDVGIYARLSVEDEDSAISESIENQISQAKTKIENDSALFHVHTYIDDGYTGLDFDRPGFEQMMLDAERGIIDCIMVKDISRIGRNYKSVGELLCRTLPSMQIRFISILDEYDSINDEDGMPTLGIILKTVLEEKFSVDISKKVFSSIQAKIVNGDFLPAAGSIPYGYLRNDTQRTYDIDEETWLVVRTIFKMRSEGESISAITNHLNEQNIPSPGKLRFLRGMTSDEKMRTSVWARATVRKILEDEAYIGNRIHGRRTKKVVTGPKVVNDSDSWTVIENAHPPIISKELFDAVQQFNNTEKDKHACQNQRAEVEHDYRKLFAGKIFCAECGSPMVPKKNTTHLNSEQTSYYYYECSTYLNSNRNRCAAHYVRDSQVYLEVKRCVETYAKKLLSKEYQKDIIAPLKNDLVDIRRKVLDIREEIESKSSALFSLYEKYADGIIDGDEYLDAKRNDIEEKAILDKKERELSTAMVAMDDKYDEIYAKIKVCRQYGLTNSLSLSLMNLVVERIEIGRDRGIKVILK